MTPQSMIARARLRTALRQAQPPGEVPLVREEFERQAPELLELVDAREDAPPRRLFQAQRVS